MSQHSWPLQKSVANSKQGFELSSLQPVAELDCYLWGVVYTAMLDHSSGRRKKLQWRPVIKLVFLSQHFIQVNLYLTLMKDVIRYMCKPDRSLSSTLSQLLWQRMFSPAVLVMSSYHDFGLKCTFSPELQLPPFEHWGKSDPKSTLDDWYAAIICPRGRYGAGRHEVNSQVDMEAFLSFQKKISNHLSVCDPFWSAVYMLHHVSQISCVWLIYQSHTWSRWSSFIYWAHKFQVL